MLASVIIATKDRKEELRTAIRSVIAQTAKPEIIVIDDGSTDETAAMISAEFPSARLVHEVESQGLIVRRNQAARLAKGDILFSIDDDAELSSPKIVEETTAEFTHPRIGAVAIPCVEPHKSQLVTQFAPDAKEIWVTDAFIGTAHALRREVFLSLGGYREELVHQGEERDYCLQLLNRGYVTRLGRSDPIRHLESARRNLSRMDFYGRRNDIVFAWQNVPMPYLPVHLIMTTLNGLRFALGCGRAFDQLRGIMCGYSGIVRNQFKRQAVRRAVYRLHRRLRTKGPLRLAEVERALAAADTDVAPSRKY